MVLWITLLFVLLNPYYNIEIYLSQILKLLEKLLTYFMHSVVEA